jgi:flagellar motility protein MotE (MotC chaperone)
VLRGIDAAFEKWRGRKSKVQAVNSLAYCAQAVAVEAQAMAGVPSTGRKSQSAPPFSLDDVRSHLEKNAADLRAAGQTVLADVAASLERLASEVETQYNDLEVLEQRLAALEDKMIGSLKAAQTDEQLFAIRRELDLQLRPYRGKLTAEQLSMLERQYLDRLLLEKASLPRLSLFYLR